MRTRSAGFIATLFIFISLSCLALADAPVVTGIQNQSTQSLVSVRVKLSAECEPVSFILNDPPRLVVDFPGADSNLVPLDEKYDDPLLKSVRLGRPTPETIRVVLDLAFHTPHRISQDDQGPDVIISMVRKVEPRSNSVNVLPGITYTARMDMTGDGPLAIHVLDVNLNDPTISIFVGIGEDRLGGREKLSSLVARKGAAIGINGGYFSMESGIPVDMLVFNRKVLLLPERYRGFFGIDTEGLPVLIRPNTEIGLKIADQNLHYVDRLNWPPEDGKMAIFTPEYGETTGTDPGRKEVVIRNNKVTAFSGGNTKIPQDGIVLSADDKNDEFINSIKLGDRAVVTISSYPDIDKIVYGISAGPTLLRDGEIQNKLTEDFTISSGIISKRNPRTAVGRTNNNHLLFVVIEGRNSRSIGMTLEELASLMKSLGAVDAINLDGGGSSQMVIGEKTVNQLPDGAERPLANAILIFHK